ncbi:prenylcysteine oxidase-like protein 1 precursor [Lindgomyces ingoldianus]|uniref:Prenylcysteine oxidase-like protein 1 n=1 Tax=Lindgomyces ingoldianus TaxID=673940 RepID=A0ACB6QIN9_9PLEO|nr:prenylcysteine oxidase-like protein 1 precursor [Lindgomyces ingoldianus]KAF2466801.1 prenylcysteine oxidase-like protein 1 precursor [Lindgomyces ingoldianus]
MHLLTPLAAALSLPLSEAFRRSGHETLDELQPQEMSAKRVAIIGAGAGGSSAAYYLSQNATKAGIHADITVFERSSHIGGRSTTVNAWSDPNAPIELGASIFVEVNHILVSAAKTFNLSTSSDDRPKPDGAPELGIWNGEEFVLVTSAEDGWWDKAKLLWRYGLAPIRTNSLMRSTVGKFLKMYEEPAFPFKSLSDVAEQVGLTNITGVTGEQFLKANSIGDQFANDVIQASTRVNYAQNLPLIHGLETMVCMAASGAMSVDRGNWQIFSQMLKASATTHLNTTVAKISKQADKTYALTTSSGDTSIFDIVILAAPLQFSKLVIDPAPKHVPDQIPYVKLHVTLFASPHKLDPTAFKLDPGNLVPQFVLTTLLPNENYGSDPNGVGSTGFFSISIVGAGLNPRSTPKNRPEYIYKIFSPKRIDSVFLSKILGEHVPEEGESANGPISWIYHKLWHSYPYEYPRVTFDEIKLDEGLFYTSGIESFISTMETSALMGKNVARLVVDEWIESAAKQKIEVSEAGEGLKLQPEVGWEFKGLKDQEIQKPLKAKL